MSAPEQHSKERTHFCRDVVERGIRGGYHGPPIAPLPVAKKVPSSAGGCSDCLFFVPEAVIGAEL
jgi:hypothetical protein